ncbi:TPA: endonuclease III [Thermoplasmata archaeon]|nr:endonuclease III [Thermoplasmata archaeon]
MGRNAVSEALRRKAIVVNDSLASTYGREELPPGENPVDTLVETILSQNTTDLNSHKAFKRLKARFPEWEELLDADPSLVADIIRSGGLADIKARRIIGALKRVKSETGRLSMDFLSERSPSEAMEWLSSIDGVGPKTAAIVVLFSFGKPAFPVDTHIFRVGRRLGLISQSASRESAQKELEGLVPEEEFYSMHINLIEHGRSKCRPRNPKCSECELSEYCLFMKTGGTP